MSMTVTDSAAQAPGSTGRIIVVDDDPGIRDVVSDFLTRHGYEVETAPDAAGLNKHLAEGPAPDLVVLDVMMPGEDGLQVCRRLSGPDSPSVIMLSAMGEETDRIVGLELGADDYLPKPCNPRELLARIRAVLRRRADAASAAPLGKTRAFGNWVLDIVQRQLSRPGAPTVALTDAEFRTLSAFLDRPQRVLTRDQLIEHARGLGSDVFDRAIDVTISRLRKKLSPDDPIRTVRNEGYMFTLRVEG